MSEERDSKISGLYQTSSQETPPPDVDRAVLAMARKSVRRRAYSPFGNHWVAGGAMVGVVIMGVLLVLEVPTQPDVYAPEDEGIEYLSESLPGEPGEYKHRKALKSEMFSRKDEVREELEPPKPRYDFYTLLPEMEVVVPDEEIQMQIQQAPAAKESARAGSTLPAEAIYLQIGSFREQAHADALKLKLVELGFKCEIQKVSIDDANVYHRVRVGPFTDYAVLDKSRKKLHELGFETQVVKKRE